MQIAFYKGSKSLWKDPGKLAAHLLICVRTLSKYSHAELVIDRVCFSSSARDKGIRGKVIDLHDGHWDVFDVRDDLDGPGAARAAFRWFADHAGTEYDWHGIYRFALPFVKQKANRWFCSEAVAAALGHPTPEKFSPADLLSLVKH